MTFESDALRCDWNFTIEQKERLPGRKEWCEQRPRVMLGMGQPQRERERKKVPRRSLQGVLGYLSPDLIVLGVNISLESPGSLEEGKECGSK